MGGPWFAGKIARVVADHGSSVAFPTRTLYLEGEVARKLTGGVELPRDFGPQEPAPFPDNFVLNTLKPSFFPSLLQ